MTARDILRGRLDRRLVQESAGSFSDWYSRNRARTRALFDLSLLYPEYRIPECIGGYARAERPVPAAYPRANTPQLWNATAFTLVTQSVLGLLPLAPLETPVLDPILPDWIPELVMHDLRVGAATVTMNGTRGTDHQSFDAVGLPGFFRSMIWVRLPARSYTNVSLRKSGSRRVANRSIVL